MQRWHSFSGLVITTILTSALPTVVCALPVGGNVSAGQATISASATQLTVNQSSNRAVLDWNGFDIAVNESVRFNQPNAASVALNRVHSGSASQIEGNLSANGQVWLVNPNGVFFGKNAQVNVAGLVASTAGISNAHFMAGNNTFDQPGNPNASITNNGTITIAQAGLTAFVAPNVINNGVIKAQLGKVQLASGDTFALDMYGDGLVSLAVSNQVAHQLVQNNGHISANGGTVLLTAAAGQQVVTSVINNSGVIEANSIGEKNGVITLYAEGSNAVENNTAANKGVKSGTSKVTNSGTLSATGYGAGESGGSVSVLGDQVTLTSGSLIDVSGNYAGGTVQIGGTLHGQGTTPAARTTIVENGATIFANALINGNGGNVTIWADNTTIFAGNAEAKGGAYGGNGGYVETSGETLSATGHVNASAVSGNAGTWLLDPATINILTGGGTDITASTIDPDTVVTALNGTNVTLAATNNITVTNAIDASGNASAGNLTLNTLTDYLNAPITLKTGSSLSGSATTVNIGASGLVQNGVDAVASTGTVNLAAATYNLSNEVFISKSLTLNGGSAILNGQNSTRVMEIDGTNLGITANLNNLTLENGNGTGTNKSGNGGGLLIYSENGNQSNVSINNSTFSGNIATSNGGAIYVDASNSGNAILAITNNTISGNSAGNIAGAIYNDNGAMTIKNSTISGNTGTAHSGGIYSNDSVTIGDTILVGNTAAGNESDFLGTSNTTGYNIYGNNFDNYPNGDTGGFVGNATDMLFTGNVNTLLAPLGNYGGPTQTMALVYGSSAYMAGGPIGSITTDQRGMPRGNTISVGAYDYDFTATSLIVNTTSDALGAIGIGTALSLRDALFYSNIGVISDPTITFDPGIFNTKKTITLTQGELVIGSSLTLNGPASGVVLDAHNASRVMEIDGASQASNTTRTINLSNLTLENGDGNETSYVNNAIGGGGLFVNTEFLSPATVNINQCIFTGNTGEGAAITNMALAGLGIVNINNSTISNNNSSSVGTILNESASLYQSIMNINNSTISNNTSSGNGGGIYNDHGTITISNSTISDNSAMQLGGGIFNDAVVTIVNSTISGNFAGLNGGGIYSNGYGSQPFTMSNSIVLGNTSPGAGSDVYNQYSSYVSNGYNLIGNIANIGVPNANAPTDIIFTGNVSSVLGPLGNYGGPTQTIPLIVGSPAINAGDPSQIGSLDQRGVVRGSFAIMTGYDADIGAYEAQGNFLHRVTAPNPITPVPIINLLTMVENSLSGILSQVLALDNNTSQTPQEKFALFTPSFVNTSIPPLPLYIDASLAGSLGIDSGNFGGWYAGVEPHKKKH